MTKVEKIIGGLIAIIVVGFALYAIKPATAPSLGSVYGNPAFVTTSTATQATTTLYAFAGILHTISITKPAAGSVITIYDSATTSSPTIAPLVITIPTTPTSTPFTLTIDGIFNNGLTIQQATATSTVNVTYQQN
jgi:hypothetical protein